MSQNLYEVLKSRFPADSNAPCMILPNGDVVSYGRLEEESARCASLLASLGVKPGDRVAVQVKKSPQVLFLYLGCLRAGAVYLPLNDAYQSHEIDYFLGDATPRVFVCRPQLRAMADEAAAKAKVAHVLELDDAGGGTLAEAAALESSPLRLSRAAVTILPLFYYTSGTTGRSKGAMLSHRNLAANAEVLHKYWGFRPGTYSCTCSPSSMSTDFLSPPTVSL